MLKALLAMAIGATVREMFRERRRLGVWWDASAGATLPELEKHLANVRELGLKDVAIMVDNQAAGFSWHYWEPDELAVFVPRLRALGVRVTLTAWPWPDPADTARLVGDFAKVGRELGVHALELDAEGYNWYRREAQGYANRTAAAADLMAGLREAFSGAIDVTVQPEALVRELSERADGVALQAYSHKGRYEWDGRYGPGHMQRLALARFQSLKGSHQLIMGLAAYNQDYVPQGTQLAMATAYDAAVATGAKTIRYWSYKHIAGSHEKSDVRRFVRSLQGARLTTAPRASRVS